jgi:hypothetical protein
MKSQLQEAVVAGGVVFCADRGQGCGETFELSPKGNGWKHINVHSFNGLKDGAFPGGVILDPNSNLFGVAEVEGGRSNGTVYEILTK